MPSPTDPSQSNVIPLSQAHAQRRGDELIEISESRIEDIFNKVLSQQVSKNFDDLQQTNEEISQKIGRLQNSMDRIISQFTAIRNGETEDPALVVTTDLNKADLAVVGVQMYQEDYYTYTTGDIADSLGIKINEVVKLVGSLGLRNNSEYHKPIKTGKKNFVQKYSQPAFDKVKQELERANGLVIPNQEIDRGD
ncbi:MAG: hypothetical protein ACK6CP_22625 [Pseudanabaena sp.]|jgi:hypothetical protein|nr:hypothetical protein [Pseudanabaena sp. M109S1SP2A07QC]